MNHLRLVKAGQETRAGRYYSVAVVGAYSRITVVYNLLCF